MNKNPKQEKMNDIISNLFNKNPKHKRIAKEINEMLEQ